MRRTLVSSPSFATLAMAVALFAAGPAQAQVAGSTTVAVAAVEASQLAIGWSAKKSILGKTVYTEAGAKIGKVEDLIVTPEKSVSYLIIGAGGFIGIGRHDVAVPVSQVREQAGRIVMPGASKETLQALPKFEYTNDSAQRTQFIAAAEADIAKGKRNIADLQGKTAAAGAEAKAKLQAQIAALETDLKAAEAKLSAMRQASASRWKEFQADLGAATAKLRKSFETASSRALPSRDLV